MFHNLNDKSGSIPGVAQPRVSQTDSFGQKLAVRSQNDFADPDKNAHQFGLREGMTVADIGSGSGRYTKAMARIVGTQGKVYAVEVQKDLLGKLETEMGAHGFHNIAYVWGNAEKIEGTKIPAGTVDCALVSNILFQVEDDKGVFAEMFRIVKPGGKLVIIDWTDSFGGMGPQPKDVYTKGEALSKGHEVGFELKNEFDAGAHHYGLILEKPKN
jgi:ubiquinone/menaquinone biosynthesis C-methylase UbiE